jgi:uncharacterized membrane protein (UPF0127 family)
MITTVLRPPIVLAAGLVLAACSGTRVDTAANPPYASQVRFGAGTPVLHVAVATTDRDRQRGLMTSAFWMKDTPVPLSIAFVDDGGRIVTIREMEPCRAEPCPVYRSDAPFVLAIEANRGWFDRHGVGIGDRATLERTP